MGEADWPYSNTGEKLTARHGYFIVTFDDGRPHQEHPYGDYRGVGYGETVWIGRYAIRSDGQRGKYHYSLREDGRLIAESVYESGLWAQALYLWAENFNQHGALEKAHDSWIRERLEYPFRASEE